MAGVCERCGLEHPDEDPACWLDLETRTPGGSPALVRRPISALFCDLVGSTELATGLDPELLHDLYSAYYAMAGRIVAAHGGLVEKFIGDGVVGVFGQLRPRTDDADRAIRAALDICAAAAGTRWPHVEAGRFAVRIGVHAGEMAFSPTPRSGTLLAGDVIAVASRLQEHAARNAVIVSDTARRAARGRLECSSAGALGLKGVASTVAAWRVGAIHGSERGRFPSPFLDREAELAVLRGLLDRARELRTPLVARITGPSGIGKSRLADRFVGTVRGARSAMASCRTAPGSSPYRPVAEALGALSPRRPGPDPAGSSPLETAHLLSSWLRGIDADSDAGAGVPVVVLDDFHEAAPEAREAVGLLPRLARGTALLLVLIEEDDAGYVGGPRPAADAEIELAGLPPHSARRLASELAAELVEVEPHDADTAVLDDLVALAEGNPLLIEQAAGLLAEHRSPVPALPRSAQAVVEQRIAALPARSRAQLEWLAVLGDVEPRHLEPLADEPGGVPAEEALELLCDLGLARRANQRPATYGLKSRLVRLALIEQQPTGLVARRHIRYAQLLAGERAHPALVARHLLAACDHTASARRGRAVESAVSRAAVAYLTTAGDAAAAERRLSEAAACFGDALRLGREHGHPAAESAYWQLYDLAMLRADHDAAASLLDELADEAAQPQLVELERAFLNLQTHPAQARERAAEVRELARRIRAASAESADPTPPRCALRAGQAGMLLDDFAEAAADLDEALRTARAPDTSPLALVPAYAGAALAAVHGPDPVPVAVERCTGLLARLAPGELLTGAAIKLPLALLMAMDDRPEQAAELLDQVDELAADLDLDELTAYAAHFRAAVYEIGQRPAQALDAYRAALGSGPPDQDSTGAGAGYVRALIEIGRTAQALRDSAAWRFTGPDRTGFALADRGLAARVCLLRGDEAMAGQLAEAAVAEALASPSLRSAGTVLLESSAVLRLLGRDEPALAAARAAEGKFALKRDLPGLRRAAELIRRDP